MTKHYKQIIAVICVFLVLCSPLGVLFSHEHECVGEDCLICSLLDTSKRIFASLAVCIAFVRPAEYSCKNLGFDDLTVYLRDETLVLQKVKLSN